MANVDDDTSTKKACTQNIAHGRALFCLFADSADLNQGGEKNSIKESADTAKV